MEKFNVTDKLQPKGDQPNAIKQLSDGIISGKKRQTLLGVTGSGKTFTMASIIEKVQKPTLVLAHNKTLAAQLAMEFKEYFPENAVEYFVSYYDYYQPEAYLPSRDILIEKEATINEEIDKLRHSATKSLLTKTDVVVVASVSAIYGLGAPSEYMGFILDIKLSDKISMKSFMKNLIEMQYERNDYEFKRGNFRVRGDSLEIILAYETNAIRFEFWGDTIDKIKKINRITGEIISELNSISIYPASHFVTKEEKLRLAMKGIQKELDEELIKLNNAGKAIESNRLKTRTIFDLEMMELNGYCSGIENYSRHLDQRKEGTRPYTLLDYFSNDFLIFIDESHMTIPQMRGMYKGDKSRKDTLVEYGFRLPSALDNRPLKYEEFNSIANQIIYVSATPTEYELKESNNIVEQIIRPTGLLDPIIEVRPSKNQIDDLIEEILLRVESNERVLITTLTKRMAEELTKFLLKSEIRTNYIHSDIDTLERVEIMQNLRKGIFDVVVGVNLLREGLDLPEVSLVVILDADKEGFLRSHRSLIQTIGRAARHIKGKAIMYADKITNSMKKTIEETSYRRDKQEEYNKKNKIIPKSMMKSFDTAFEKEKQLISSDYKDFKKDLDVYLTKASLEKKIKELRKEMEETAKKLDFIKAAEIRDKIKFLKDKVK